MRIHKEGFATIVVCTLVFAAINMTAFYFLKDTVYSWIVLAATFGLLIFIFSFFRIPHRLFTEGDDAVVSPCDGTVVVIEEVQPDEYFTDKRLQLSIFMSPLNVHVNRNPVSGEVVYSKYHPGKFLVAWHPEILY
jgi:phosphatidylserine decarboxylase